MDKKWYMDIARQYLGTDFPAFSCLFSLAIIFFTIFGGHMNILFIVSFFLDDCIGPLNDVDYQT